MTLIAVALLAVILAVIFVEPFLPLFVAILIVMWLVEPMILAIMASVALTGVAVLGLMRVLDALTGENEEDQ